MVLVLVLTSIAPTPRQVKHRIKCWITEVKGWIKVDDGGIITVAMSKENGDKEKLKRDSAKKSISKKSTSKSQSDSDDTI